jgi:methylglutaconyl-CoA hydratase
MLGLVDEVVADAAALAAAQARLADEMMACAPGAVEQVKRLAADVWRSPGHDHARDMARRAAQARDGDEGREGVAAALAARPPAWSQP